MFNGSPLADCKSQVACPIRLDEHIALTLTWRLNIHYSGGPLYARAHTVFSAFGYYQKWVINYDAIATKWDGMKGKKMCKNKNEKQLNDTNFEMDFVQCQQPTADTDTMHNFAGRWAVLPDTYLITREKNERYMLLMAEKKKQICIWNGMGSDTNSPTL